MNPKGILGSENRQSQECRDRKDAAYAHFIHWVNSTELAHLSYWKSGPVPHGYSFSLGFLSMKFCHGICGPFRLCHGTLHLARCMRQSGTVIPCQSLMGLQPIYTKEHIFTRNCLNREWSSRRFFEDLRALGALEVIFQRPNSTARRAPRISRDCTSDGQSFMSLCIGRGAAICPGIAAGCPD